MEVLKRKASRAVIVTPENDILLIKVDNPDGSWTGWITPGGGIDKGEEEIDGLKRELFEELGLRDFEVGPRIWTRFHKFPWRGKLIEQEEVYFLLRVNRFEVCPTLNPDTSEMLDLKEFRWWTFEEVMKSSARFAPTKLQVYFHQIVQQGAPKQIVDVGV